MDQHALAILKDIESWEWPITQCLQESGTIGEKFKAVSTSLLYWLIVESQKLGGTVLDQFWLQLEECHRRFKENIPKLRATRFSAKHPERSSILLFEGLDGEEVDFTPLFNMAAEYFTHLGVALINLGGPKSKEGTPFSVSDIIAQETEELLEMATNDGTYGKQRQVVLKALSFKRDGMSCPLTGLHFRPHDMRGVEPVLAHVIPHAVHGKSDTLKCIAMFAGRSTRDEIMKCLNNISNAMNLQMDAHVAYDDLEWGIEAKEENGNVRYIYRTIPHTTLPGPGLIRSRDGDEIMFGQGPDGERLNKGPLPKLCNLQLAVARVLKMSAAADIILRLEDEADDSDFPHVFIASEEFCKILDARLLLSGQAMVV